MGNVAYVMTQEVSMFEKNYGPEINALTNGLVRKFDLNQREAYDEWCIAVGYHQDDPACPSYDEWLQMEEMKDEEKAN